MPFEKGHNLSTGRPKGSKNKVESVTKQAIRAVIEGNLEKVAKELAKLEGKPFMDVYLSMMEFTEPKLSRAEIEQTTEDVTNEINLDDLDDRTIAKLLENFNKGEDTSGTV